MINKPIISTYDLTVSYNETVAVEKCNLEIFADDFVGIIGPNGGGKTSLVKAILHLVDYKGGIDYSPELLRRGAIGYLPQQNSFDKSFPISVLELVLSGLQSQKGFFGQYTARDRQRARELIEQMGIASVAERPVGEISGGQLQRGLLCRAVIGEPRLLILDEPANFVDNNFEKELYDILRALNERMTIMMVSHDVGTITTVVKSVVCVNRTVHRHPTAELTSELLDNYRCPIQVISHGRVPHTVLGEHE
ncbi:MAG: ABC transporter ATP-binding protein [Tidjanibacter sp.]|nr:ABC transporter ATP-binding protein [Tidjanibacter sp.]